jgi:hypothetical protein
MRPGDKVRCVRESDVGLLKAGEIYEIAETDGEWLSFRLDDHELVDALASRFELVYEQAPAAPSEEAMKLAYDLTTSDYGQKRVAAALQKLMDERDSLKSALVLQQEETDHQLQRAEAAEKERDIANKNAEDHGHWCVSHKLRAEAAEKDAAEQRQLKCIALDRAEVAERRITQLELDKYQLQQESDTRLLRAEAAEKARQESAGTAARAIAARNIAEARLAECVREVRAAKDHPEYLGVILDKYSPSATPPRPETFSTKHLNAMVFVDAPSASATTPRPLVTDTPEHPDTVRLRECLCEVQDCLKNGTWTALRVALRMVVNKYEVQK